VDWADHLWAEVRIDGQWVHLDPCEAAVDEPLLYQSWGKNQTYIFAFTSTRVVDVTGDYTSNLAAAKQRREVDDKVVAESIHAAENMLQCPAENMLHVGPRTTLTVWKHKEYKGEDDD